MKIYLCPNKKTHVPHTNKRKRAARFLFFPLKFELSCGRQDGFCYEHVLYEDEYDEKEFPGFREAIDYLKGIEQKAKEFNDAEPMDK